MNTPRMLIKRISLYIVLILSPLVFVLMLPGDEANAWTNIKPSWLNTDLFAADFPANSQRGFVAGAGGVIARTINSGVTWTAQTSGTSNDLFGLCFPLGDTTGWAVGAGGTILKTTNSGGTWTAQTSGVSTTLYSVAFPADETTGWAVGAGGVILKTANGGATWTAQTSGTTLDLYEVEFFPGSSVRGYIAAGGGNVVQTFNGGAAWEVDDSAGITSNLFGAGLTTQAWFGYMAGAAGVVLKTTDGNSWNLKTTDTTAELRDIVFPNSVTAGWAVGAGGTIITTTNGGSHWNADTSGTTQNLYRISGGPANSRLYVVGQGGIILYEQLPSHDNSAPSITNNQAGDTAWRTSNNGTYNVDFNDSGGSRLDYFQIQACSTNANCGGVADWTAVVSNIDANSYNTDWALPSAFWTALAQGTNYISVSVYDGAGNTAVAGPAFYVKKDTLAPTSGVVTTDNAGSATHVDGTFNLSTTFTDGTGSGVVSCQVCKSVDGVCDTEWAAATWNSGSCSTNALTCTNAQTLTLNMRATDLVGFTGTAVAVSRTCDATAPTTADNWTDNWTGSGSVSVTLTGTDNSGGSGVATTYYCVDSANNCTPGTSGTSVSVSCAAGTVCTQYVRYNSVDAVGNAEAVKSKRVRQDLQAPSGGAMSFTDGYYTALSVAVSFTNGGDGTGSGVASRALQRSGATFSGDACGSYGAWATIATNPGSSPYSDTTVANGNCYQYRYLETDNVSNQAIYTSASTAKVDTAPPSTTDNWTDNWTGSSPVTVILTPTDAESGVQTTLYCVDTADTCTPSTVGTSVAVTCAANAICTQFTRYFSKDNANNSETVKSKRVRQDLQAPTGGTVSYTDGYYTALSVAVSFTNGSDGSGSGIASRKIQRAGAAMTNGVCGSYGAFADLVSNPPSSLYNDSTVADGTCYQYRYVETDNVSNQAIYTSASAAKVDSQAPAAFTACSQIGLYDVAGGQALSWDTPYSYNNPKPYFSWTARTDNPAGANSGVSGYYVYFGADSGADPAVSGSFSSSLNFTNTALTMTPVTSYYFKAKVKDNAGNTSASSPACQYIFTQGAYINVSAFDDDNTYYGNDLGSSENPDGILAPDNTDFEIVQAALYDQNGNLISTGDLANTQVTLTLGNVGLTGAYISSTNLTSLSCSPGAGVTACSGNLVAGRAWLKMKANGSEVAGADAVSVTLTASGLSGVGGHDQVAYVLVRNKTNVSAPISGLSTLAAADSGQLIFNPVWSPAGDSIAYMGKIGGAWNIYRKTYSGGSWGAAAVLTNSAMAVYTAGAFTWTADGQYVVFSAMNQTDLEQELYAVKADGSDAAKTQADLETAGRKISDLPYDINNRRKWIDSDWSPTTCSNGYQDSVAAAMSRIINRAGQGEDIFLVNGSKTGGLYHEIGASPANITQLTDFPGFMLTAMMPRWSHDCSKITFVVLDGVGSPSKMGVYIMNLTDATWGPTVASFPVTSLTQQGMNKIYECSATSCTIGAAVFPSFSADNSTIFTAVDTSGAADIRGLQNSDITGAFYNGKNFDNFAIYVGNRGTYTTQRIGQSANNEFDLTQCYGASCPNSGGGKPITYVTQSTATTGDLLIGTLSNESSVTANGGIMFMNGSVVAVIPPGAVSAETKLQVSPPPPLSAGLCGGFNADCKDQLVSSGVARDFFPDGVIFNNDILMLFKYCDSDSNGYLDVNQDAGCTGGGNTLINENKLYVYYWCDANTHAGCSPDTWVQLNGSIDPSGNVITVATNHFSLYDPKALLRAGFAPAVVRDMYLENPHTFPNPWRTSDGNLYFNIGANSAFNTLAEGAPGMLTTMVEIYDIRGRLVRSLYGTIAGITNLPTAVNGNLSSSGEGVDLVAWDGRNNGGTPVASGVYIYHLSVTDGVQSRDAKGKLSVLR